MSAYTSVPNLGQFGPSTQWPEGIQFNNNQSIYRASVQLNWNVTPLDHVHVIAFDRGIQTDMLITLPIVDRLPLGSRIYFFYVEGDLDGDTLTFLPVFGSGNTTNGEAFGFTYELVGRNQLYVALALGNNYIIRPFAFNQEATVADGIPTMRWTVDGGDPVINDNTILTIPAGSNTAFYKLPVDSEEIIVDGMVGYLVPDTPIPTQTFTGFLCTVSGWYSFTPAFNLYVAISGGTALKGAYESSMNEFELDGSNVGTYHRQAGNLYWSDTECRFVYSSQMFIFCTEGRYYTFQTQYDLGGGTVSATAADGSSKITAQYWGTGPGPLLGLRSAGEPMSAQKTFKVPESVATGKVSAEDVQKWSRTVYSSRQAPPINIAQEQKRMKEKLSSSSSSSSSSFASSASSSSNISQSDVEAMVRQYLLKNMPSSSSNVPQSGVYLKSGPIVIPERGNQIDGKKFPTTSTVQPIDSSSTSRDVLKAPPSKKRMRPATIFDK